MDEYLRVGTVECRKILAETARNASLLLLNPRKIPLGELQRIDASGCRLDSCKKAAESLNEAVDFLHTSDLIEEEREYTRLFVSSYPTLPCPLYESVYMGKRGELADPNVLRDLDSILSALNLEVNTDHYTLPDSLPVELELSHILLGLEEVNPVEAQPLIRVMLVEHLAAWLPSISECIASHSSNPYYKLVSRALHHIADCILSLY